MLKGEWGKLKEFWDMVRMNPPGKITCPDHTVRGCTELSAIVFDNTGTERWRGVLAKNKEITDVFVNSIVSAMVNSTDADIHGYKYHHSGTGTDCESQTSTQLLAITTETGRVAGTQVTATDTQGGKSYSSVATITYTTTSTGLVIMEHGLFNTTSSTDARSWLADRSVFGAITVQNGWSIQFTYIVTFIAGS